MFWKIDGYGFQQNLCVILQIPDNTTKEAFPATAE